MDPLNIICLYSQYSKVCDFFINKIKQNQIDFIHLIPVDTLHSRKILNGRVSTVPSIVIQYPTNIEIYEGQKATDWIEEVIENKIKENKIIEENNKLEQQRKNMAIEQQRLKQELEELKKQKEELQLQPPPPAKTEDKYTPIDDVLTPDSSITNNDHKPSASVKKTQDLLARARELEKGRDEINSKKPIHN